MFQGLDDVNPVSTESMHRKKDSHLMKSYVYAKFSNLQRRHAVGEGDSAYRIRLSRPNLSLFFHPLIDLVVNAEIFCGVIQRLHAP